MTVGYDLAGKSLNYHPCKDWI